MGIEKANIERIKKSLTVIDIGSYNICNTCPCFDSNTDWGEKCNLGIHFEDTYFNHQFYHLSKECNIQHIVGFNDQGDRVKEFYIDKVIIEEEFNASTES